ncbi:MAG TPA: flagellar hook-associated protein FlgK [Gammaproteobacteria bacterium]|nr:flagellar hook-associated protein FlgK [Gammaproteobacteria bacterium]
MSEMFSIGISALLANQKLLATTGHNISNVNTEGFSRQRVTLIERPPQFSGVGFSGKGVEVGAIERLGNEFLTTNVRLNTSSEARAAAFANLSAQVDTLLSDGTFTPALERFFNALQDANNDPSSTPARLVFVNAAETLTDRFQDLESRLATMAQNVNQDIAAKVGKLNSMAQSLGALNREIVQQIGIGQGAQPNDLLDQRDLLLKNMAKLVNLNVVPQQDGSVNVFVGKGQLLVANTEVVPLKAVANPLDGSRMEIAVQKGGTVSIISDSITGGEIAGALDFRDQVLEPARNGIGRLSAVMVDTYNAQHRQGVDLRGAMGGNLFARGEAQVNRAASNTGTVGVSLDPANLDDLTLADYRLFHDGTNFTLERLDNGATQTLSGAGPFTVDGMTITIGTAPAAGDTYLIQPTKYVARDMAVGISDPLAVAFANPVKSSAGPNNTGNATITAPTVLDAGDSALQTTAQIVFNDPPTTYQIGGTGPLIPYTSGTNIDVNGWSVQIKGTPVAGDTFTVEANANGRGDNANGLLMFGLRSTEIMDGNTATYQDAYSQLLGQVGARTQQAQISRDALKVQLENAEAARDEIAGVNLDEEAANLIRYQQSYQGAAQVIAAADLMFQALIDAMRR